MPTRRIPLGIRPTWCLGRAFQVLGATPGLPGIQPASPLSQVVKALESVQLAVTVPNGTAGVDGRPQYAVNLKGNVQSLLDRTKSGDRYRATGSAEAAAGMSAVRDAMRCATGLMLPRGNSTERCKGRESARSRPLKPVSRSGSLDLP